MQPFGTCAFSSSIFHGVPVAALLLLRLFTFSRHRSEPAAKTVDLTVHFIVDVLPLLASKIDHRDKLPRSVLSPVYDFGLSRPLQ